MDEHDDGWCLEHNLTVSAKYLSLCLSVCQYDCVCDKNFVASVAREQMHKI